MSRPLLVTDCDEVLLHMVVPFRQWLDETHQIHFDFAGGDFARALRHKFTGDLVDREQVWPLLNGFFETEMHRQQPIAGAVEALRELAQGADIVILTNIGEEAQASRADQLARVGIDHRVIGNRGGKGVPLAGVIAEYQPSVTVFVDDLGTHHESSATHAPDAWRLHMVGEPELAPIIPPAPFAHARIDRWGEAKGWIQDIFARGEAAAP
ncbi:HAD family hydrolase [Rhizorhapis sp. SPR117]|uniref:HAD family hydrolase n=1 Tax=Rhizorhapis sp. SPR117 TaxID=2912611 RepID=UPI001F26AF2A|nr:HAD family hydrolase [Rhizorhapis sp. SPR117]